MRLLLLLLLGLASTASASAQAASVFAARRACDDAARAQGWVITDVSATRPLGGSNVQLDVRVRDERARTGGFTGYCIYDARRNRASIVRADGAGLPGGGANSGALMDRAVAACRAEVRREGYDVRRVADTRREGRENARVEFDARRRGTDYLVTCAYEGRRDRARVTDARATSGGNEGNYGATGAEAARRREAARACQAEARRERLTVVETLWVRPARRDTYEARLLVREGRRTAEVGCIYDQDRRRARLTS